MIDLTGADDQDHVPDDVEPDYDDVEPDSPIADQTHSHDEQFVNIIDLTSDN